MSKTKRQIDLLGHDFQSEQEKFAWQKVGFKGRNDVYEKVRNLPAEERLDLLTEIFIKEMSQVWFERWVDFQVGLGKETVVTAEEMISYIKKNYKDTDDVKWNIRDYTFHSMHIYPKTMSVEICNSLVLEKLRKRQGRQ